MNTLKLDLESLNEAIGQLDIEQKFLLITSIEAAKKYATLAGDIALVKKVILVHPQARPPFSYTLQTSNLINGSNGYESYNFPFV